MRYSSKRVWETLAQGGVILAFAGCSSAPQVEQDGPGPGSSSSGGATQAQPSGSPVFSTPLPIPSLLTDGGSPSPSGTAPVTGQGCSALTCNPGQHCEDGADAGASCVDNSCDELECDADEKCAAHELGGFTCVTNSCENSVDCRPEEFCNDEGLCAADVCEAQVLSCGDETVLACDSAGGGEVELFSCDSQAYFTSTCSEGGPDTTGCSCEDDWDCPAFTACEVGLCKGTGKEPSCSLPPLPFADTPPAVEIHWGGDAANNDLAHDGTPEKNPSPWAAAAHVQSTPMVANLDDDNGDGLVNELDFPEIVFISYADGGDTRGVVRAIHGGGPTKGKDMFAVCGTSTWSEAEPFDTTSATCTDETQPTSRNAVAIGDLDRDGLPEIAYVTRGYSLIILNNRGSVIYLSEEDFVAASSSGNTDGGSTPAIADLDHAGLPEIVIGNQVFVLGVGATTAADGGASTGLIVTHRFTSTLDSTGMHNGTGGVNYGDAGAPPGIGNVGSSMGPTSCIADLHPDPGQEILAGAVLYRLPEVSACATPPCLGALDVVWDASALLPELYSDDGYCAVADVWGEDLGAAPGPDNPPDGNAEAILIADGHIEVFEGATGELIFDTYLEGGALGGAPNVDDFDGDGFMEIGSALSDFMTVIDLQEPSAACPAWPAHLPRQLGTANDNPNLATAPRMPGGACTDDADCADGAVCNQQMAVCVCLHNGWTRESDDNSSKVTSTSVFDFNGDGASEVLYNDECEFRVYSGMDGTVLYNEISRSRTAMENPIVADVDNDGNAEVVTVLNTEEANRCDDDTGAVAGPNGLRIWGDPQDSWVSARRIWNQFAYHVTNITEGGAVPVHEPESWRPYNDRLYNTYRSQPRSQGAAPDLQVTGVSLSSPDVACGKLGDSLDITFEITNAGDLRVGPGVQVSFYGTWDGVEVALQGPTGPLTFELTTSLEPGKSVIATVNFDLLNQSEAELPSSVRVEVDTGGAMDSDFGAERECIEDNNDLEADVTPGKPRPDLSVQLGEASVQCSSRTASVEVTIKNTGTADATDIVIEIFAGDPAAGGTSMLVYPVPGTLDAGETESFTVEVPGFPNGRSIVLWGVIDPENAIAECNEGDNSDPADNPIRCNLPGQT
jgi:CARDB